MRGHLRKRSNGSWTLVYTVDGKQKWSTVRGTKKQAETKLTELLEKANKGTFVEPTKTTFAEWLDEWLESSVKPPSKRQRTYENYESIVRIHLKPALGHIRLQQLQATDIKKYHTEKSREMVGGKKVGLSPATLQLHQSIIHNALTDAERSGLLQRNVAKLVIGKPRYKRDTDAIKENCWTAEEAKRFLEVAREAGPQPGAFYTTSLESGMRKSELCGLLWEDIDLEKQKIQVVRQLLKPGSDSLFGPTKNNEARSIDISPELVGLLAAHKKNQAELKMRNRHCYHDHGLVFAKDWSNIRRKHDVLGDPLLANNIGQREFAQLIKKAGVRTITFHGMRHTCATLALQAGIHPKVVQERLGHKKIEITLNTYSHVVPSMQKEAASKLAALLNR